MDFSKRQVSSRAQTKPRRLKSFPRRLTVGAMMFIGLLVLQNLQTDLSGILCNENCESIEKSPSTLQWMAQTLRRQTKDNLLVQKGDSIYDKTIADWDSAPVVIEQYKLIFFTSAKVGCTVWKQLFRRMLGLENWNIEDYETMIPWNPRRNGLKYLWHYSRRDASEMMMSPDWTRAIFVRDPIERFLSAYLDKAVSSSWFIKRKCCDRNSDCVKSAKRSPVAFLRLIQFCENTHWKPQSRRMEDKYWPYINFVGRMETVTEDAKRLLERIGAWEEFGKSGWGQFGNESIYQAKAGGAGRQHATDAKSKLIIFINSHWERDVVEYYADDYANQVLNFTMHPLLQRRNRTGKPSLSGE